MFGSIFVDTKENVALGLIGEEDTVEQVLYYKDSGMIAVVGKEAGEVFMTSEMDPLVASSLQKNSVIHIGHVSEEGELEREYTVPLVISG